MTVGVWRDKKAYGRWLQSITKHGAYKNYGETPEHYVWREMLRRCRDNHPNYEHVTVCKRWLKFENFISDMDERPSPKYSIDRFPDNTGGYKPSNCRWATPSQQSRNKRTHPLYKQGHIIGTLSDWADILNVSKELLHWRWKKWGTFVKGREWCELPKIG